MDRLICLNTALWSVNSMLNSIEKVGFPWAYSWIVKSMLNSEDPTQWYSKVVRIEKVGFP